MIEQTFRAEYGRCVAILTRVFGDIDIAEDAVQEAFAIAAEKWPVDGMPPNPGGWITTTARNRALDRLRRESSRDDRQAQAVLLHAEDEPIEEVGGVRDDRLRMIFTCCHPALGAERAGAAHVAIARRPARPRRSPRVPRARADDGAADRAGEAQDPRRSDPVPCARGGRAAGPAASRARRRLPDLQRGLHRERGDALVRDDLCAEAVRLARAARRAHARRARGDRVCSRCCC